MTVLFSIVSWNQVRTNTRSRPSLYVCMYHPPSLSLLKVVVDSRVCCLMSTLLFQQLLQLRWGIIPLEFIYEVSRFDGWISVTVRKLEKTRHKSSKASAGSSARSGYWSWHSFYFIEYLCQGRLSNGKIIRAIFLLSFTALRTNFALHRTEIYGLLRSIIIIIK